MTSEQRREQILQIIEQNPGASGARICVEMGARSWAGRWFGRNSLLCVIFGANSGTLYPHLMQLEQAGRIMGVWGERTSNGGRRRHYYVAEPQEAASPRFVAW